MELLNQKELQQELIRKEVQIEHCSRMISKYDKKVSKIYHDIEFGNKCNASQGYKKYDELRAVLIERRNWKDARPMLVREHTDLKRRYKKQERLSKLKQKKKINRIVKKKDWSKKFSPEANAILSGLSI